MQIRQEEVEDEQPIGEVYTEAFFRSESPHAVPQEVVLIDQLRVSSAWIPALSLVAVEDRQILGHVVCTRAHVEDEPVLALGPIGVRVARQNHGIGAALMRAVIGAADELDETLIGLLGSTTYYSRFGFVPASEMGIESPDPRWGDHFQILRLAGFRSTIKGRFTYADPFEMVEQIGE